MLLALTVAACVAVNPVTALSFSPTTRQPTTSFTVLQMNLCLSGMAGCYPRTVYPSIVDEAAEQAMINGADAVTLNEVCRGDAADIALRTGYRMRFTAVLGHDVAIRCVAPGRRGVFGLAVLTKERIRSSEDDAFATHAGLEERGWLCVTTVGAISVCTAHLDTRESQEARRANDAECAELQGVLARYGERGATMFGGDVNRQRSCAPAAMWTRKDTAATQHAGIQHIYGSTSPNEPSAGVAAATYTDHDFFSAAGRVGPTAVRRSFG
jgi:endonuclease/exonuclease/phosphatase family metal-dependent hydrolase